jgi:hypothetical protein
MALTMMACNQPPDSHDADVKAIEHKEPQWNQDYGAKGAACHSAAQPHVKYR